MPSLKVRSTTRAATTSTNTIVAPAPWTVVATMIAADHREDAERVGGEAVAQAEAAEQEAGEQQQEHDVDAVGDGGELAHEPGELGAVLVALRGAVEHQEVEPLALDGREHLERDDEHHVAVAGRAPGASVARSRRPSCSTAESSAG